MRRVLPADTAPARGPSGPLSPARESGPLPTAEYAARLRGLSREKRDVYYVVKRYG